MTVCPSHWPPPSLLQCVMSGLTAFLCLFNTAVCGGGQRQKVVNEFNRGHKNINGFPSALDCGRSLSVPWVYSDCSAPPENRKQTKGAWKFHVQPSSSPREGRKVIFIAWDLNHLTDCCCLCSPPQFYDGNHQVIRRSLESAEIMSLVAVKALVCNRTCTARTIWDQTKDQPSLYIHSLHGVFFENQRKKLSKSSIWQFICMSEPADWCY